MGVLRDDFELWVSGFGAGLVVADGGGRLGPATVAAAGYNGDLVGPIRDRDVVDRVRAAGPGLDAGDERVAGNARLGRDIRVGKRRGRGEEERRGQRQARGGTGVHERVVSGGSPPL